MSKLFDLVELVDFSDHTNTTHNGHACIYDDHVDIYGLVVIKDEVKGILSV